MRKLSYINQFQRSKMHKRKIEKTGSKNKRKIIKIIIIIRFKKQKITDNITQNNNIQKRVKYFQILKNRVYNEKI